MPDDARTQAERRAQLLRAAAQAKRQAAITRAEAGLRTVLKNNEPIEFRHLARTAGVSVNFLYNNTELRARIERLRAQQLETVHPAPEPAEGSERAVVRVLTAKLKDERRRHQEQVATLRAQLAAAHGELLQARRREQLPPPRAQGGH